MMILPAGSVISGDAGHNAYPDTGAQGTRKEDDLTREVWLKLQGKLKSLGYIIVDCTPWDMKFNSVNGSLGYRVRTANKSGSKLHLCIHFNSGGGTGVECLIVPGGNAEEFAKQICSEISKDLDIPNRGVKDGSKLYVPRYTNMSCVLIECAFVDSKSDMEKYNGDIIAKAIVKAVTNAESTSEDTVQPIKPNVNINYVNSILNPNAEIINDWFYVRDASGNIIPGKVDIGDKIEVLDISYSKQLTLVKYPVSRGTRTEYIKNVPENIKYFYQDQYKNGSTPESVYQDSGLTYKIGSLSPRENATPLYRQNERLHIAYSTDKGTNTKSGYVKYNGKFSKF